MTTPTRKRQTALIETRIDLADRHTSLYHLNDPALPGAPLPLGDESGYAGLYEKVIKTPGIKYAALRGVSKSAIMDGIFPVFKDSERTGKKGYWRRYLGLIPDAESVWPEALPLKCKITERIELTAPQAITAKLSPTPYVLLYPFGWSAWINLRITGKHTIEELSEIMMHLATDKSFTVSGKPGAFTVGEIFDLVAAGVRTDAFGGDATRDTEPSEMAQVTTVLAKNGPSLSLGALSDDDDKQIRQIVRPTGPQSKHTLAELATPLKVEGELNYMIIDKMSRFTWMEERLIPEGRNHDWLNCYHNNSFLALVQAWHFEGLVAAAAKAPNKSARLVPLLETAEECLDKPRFPNASVLGFTKKLAADAGPKK